MHHFTSTPAATDTTKWTSLVDDFKLAYDSEGAGPVIVLLHGWPGDRSDWYEVAQILKSRYTVLRPDLRGFGESDKHDVDAEQAYSTAAQSRSIIAMLDDLAVKKALVAGYDVGSRVAQHLAREYSDRVAGIVVSPPLPGIGRSILNKDIIGQYWYQAFHTTGLVEQLVDGDAGRVAAYLTYFWSKWSAPLYTVSRERIRHLTSVYEKPGAMTASVKYYQAGSGLIQTAAKEEVASPPRIHVPTEILWPGSDALLLEQWRDQALPFFSHARTTTIEGSGHFLPVEAPSIVSAHIARLAEAVLSDC